MMQHLGLHIRVAHRVKRTVDDVLWDIQDYLSVMTKLNLLPFCYSPSILRSDYNHGFYQ